MVTVIGHKSPDTDSVVSAIVCSSYLKKKRINAIPAVVGKVNKETDLVLERMKEKKPLSLKKARKNDKFYLVDHNGLEQSLSGIKKENILGFIDHHQLAGTRTSQPIFCRCQPVGSTSTIIFEMFKESGFRLTKKESGLLLGGIISDTLKFTSPTTTGKDKKIARLLAKEGGIKIGELAQEMFRAKSDISGMSPKEIIMGDYKEYDFLKAKIGVGVYETISISAINEIKEKIFKEIGQIKKERNIDLIFFAVISILKKECFLYLDSPQELKIIQKAFKGKYIKKGIIKIAGITSRKKQIIPPLYKILN